MSEEYNEYLKNHIGNVQKGAEFFVNYFPEILYDGNSYIGYELLKICSEHDKSKYDEEEYGAYDNYFYGNKSKKVEDEFNLAWLRHIHKNPHHWQHWVLMEDDPETNSFICIEMPNKYIFEMICDWWSFSWQKGKLDEIFEWYKNHKDTIKLHENTRTKVEFILNKLYDFLNKEEDLYYQNKEVCE